MRVLVCGASIAGPVLAYWLARAGFEVTVVERADRPRKAGGHAVDLFRPAMEISERMGVLARIEARATGIERLVGYREGAARPVTIDLTTVYGAVSDRHVEIMRDDLSEVYYEATRDDVEYVFGDTVTALGADGDVELASGPPRRFDLVVGADGLHSTVRSLTFGPERQFTRFIGAYLAVLSLPGRYSRPGELTLHLAPGRMAGLYGARHDGDARAVFLFRTIRELDVDHRDGAGQRAVLRSVYAGLHNRVDGWLAQLDAGGPFYFDAITQLAMPTWSRGRVTLVGDAGYGPGPAVGGGTSLAVFGAYTLAGELAAAGGDHTAAFAACERVLAEPVRASRAFALRAARSLVPRSDLGIRALLYGTRLMAALPAGPTRALARWGAGGVRVHDSFPVRDYPLDARRGPDRLS